MNKVAHFNSIEVLKLLLAYKPLLDVKLTTLAIERRRYTVLSATVVLDS